MDRPWNRISTLFEVEGIEDDFDRRADQGGVDFEVFECKEMVAVLVTVLF